MKKYCANISTIELGDIVLSTSKKNATSIAIRALTKSYYSHAALILDRTMLMEARENGVFSLNILRSTFDSPHEFIVVRCTSITQLQKEKIDEFARSKGYGSPYNWEELLTALIKKSPDTDRKKFYCSQFIYECYKYASIDLVQDKFLHKYITPQNLFNSRLLKPISNYFMELDRDPNQDGNLGIMKQRESVNKFIHIASQKLSKYGIRIENFNDIFNIYEQIEAGKINSDVFHAVDADLISSLEESRYCYAFEDGYIPNSIVAQGVDALIDSQPTMKYLDLLEDTFNTELLRYKKEYQKFITLHQMYFLNFYNEIALLYLKLIGFTERFLATVLDAKSKIGQ